MRLEEEGLLEAIPSGGFAVKAFSEREVFEAIEIRGTLEGLAARLAAERGVGRDGAPDAPRSMPRRHRRGRAGRRRRTIDISRYVELNAQFHALLIDLAGQPGAGAPARARQRAALRLAERPRAGAVALAGDRTTSSTVAQDQHRCVLDAIERREGARAEAIMREHARIAHRNLERALANQRDMDLVPGRPSSEAHPRLICKGERRQDERREKTMLRRTFIGAAGAAALTLA